MEAPEKIYLQICGECKDNDCKNCKFEDLEENVTHCKDKIFDNDIEYTRTDAVIEKMEKWIKENFVNDQGLYCVITDYNTVNEMIEEFRKYMKGE